MNKYVEVCRSLRETLIENILTLIISTLHARILVNFNKLKIEKGKCLMLGMFQVWALTLLTVERSWVNLLCWHPRLSWKPFLFDIIEVKV